MNTQPERLARMLRLFSAIIVVTVLQSCGSGSSSSPPPLASLATSLTVEGAPIAPEAKVAGATPVIMADAGSLPRTLAITYSDGTFEQLPNDRTDKTRFWMPVVTEVRKGTLVASQDGKAVASMPISVAPYETGSAPGQVTLYFLRAAQMRQQAAIDIFTANPQYARELNMLLKHKIVIDQQVAWVSEAITNGSAVVDDPWRSGKAVLDQSGLKVFDQYVMNWVAHVLPGQTTLVSAMSAQHLLLALLPSARADTFTTCRFDMPSGLPPPKSVQEAQAFCVAQVRINDAEEIANYLAAAGDALKYSGIAIGLAFPPAGAGLAGTGLVIGWSGDLLSILASATNGRLDETAAKALALALREASGQLIKLEGVPFPAQPDVRTTYVDAASETIASWVESQFGDAIDKATSNIVDLSKQGTGNPPTNPEPPSVPEPAPPPAPAPEPEPEPEPPPAPTLPQPPDGPRVGLGEFSISKPLSCTVSDGTARVTGQFLADLAPGEQITVVYGTKRFYTGVTSSCGGADMYSVPEGALPSGTSLPPFEYASSDCKPSTGLSLHPVFFATCHNRQESQGHVGVAVDINSSVSNRMFTFSPEIVMIMCRATTLNLNSQATVAKARPQTVIHVPLVCAAATSPP